MVQVGDTALRTEVVEATVKGFAERAYKFKQAVSVQPSSAWKNTFWRETNAPVTPAGAGNSVEGVPRGAAFPEIRVTWSEVPTYIKKHAAQGTIHWEDILASEIDTQGRTMFRIGESVAKSVDDEIWDVLTETRPANGSYNINEVIIAPGKHWSGTSAAIMDNVANAIQLIAEDNYPTENLLMFVSPKDLRSIKRWVTDKGAQFVPLSDETARSGRVGKFGGVTIVESNSVTASYALVVVPQRVGTWKELVAFQSTTITDPYKSVTIRAVEEGVCQLTDFGAAAVIHNTQGVGVE